MIGIGNIKVVVFIMVLGLDLCFDLSKVYWLVVGISGVDFVDVLMGFVVWVEWFIDGDFSYEIDVCEIFEDWKIGYIFL